MIYVICGKKRSGKDTLAKILCKNINASSIALADHIKYYLEDAGYKSSKNSILHDSSSTKLFWKDDRESPLLLNNTDVCSLFQNTIDLMAQKGVFSLYPNQRQRVEDFIADLELTNTELWSVRRIMQVFGTDIVCNLIDDSVWVNLAIARVLYRAKQADSDNIVITDCRQEHEYKYLSMLGAKFIFVQKDDVPADSHSTERGLIPNQNDIVVPNNGTLEEFEQLILNKIIKECL